MTTLAWIAGAVALVGLLGLALRRKVRRDGIYQDKVRVGSALLAEIVRPDAEQARFVIVRGEPAFQEREPFEHAGMTFRIISAAGYDDSSTVLRRFIDVTCQVVARGGGVGGA